MYDAETYVERVNRFVVEYHEELPAEHKAQMRIYGIDPDDHWQLKWSFEEQASAAKQYEKEIARYNNFCQSHGYTPTKKFRVRDLGAPVEITRSVMF